MAHHPFYPLPILQVLTGTCVDYWSPKTLRSSMGAAFRLPSLRLETWNEVVGEEAVQLGTLVVDQFWALQLSGMLAFRIAVAL